MCGNVGVAGVLNLKQREVFQTLLIIDAIRGRDGTGVAGVTENSNHFEVLKRYGDPYQIIDHKGWDRVVSHNKKVLIGHNRAATIGSKNHNNAHPFEMSNVVGAHNGTLWPQAKSRLRGSNIYDTDSEAIYHEINHSSLRETIPKLEGAWALCYYDRRDDTINFIRNKERPLFYVYEKDRKTMWWASEPGMLLFALGRHGIELDTEKVYGVTEDTHYSWKVATAKDAFTEPTNEQVKGHQFVNQQNYRYHQGGYFGGEDYGAYDTVEDWRAQRDKRDNPLLIGRSQTSQTGPNNSASSNNVVAGVSSSDKKQSDNVPVVKVTARPILGSSSNVVDASAFRRARDSHRKFRPPYKDCNGKVLNKVQFMDYVEDGCTYCGAVGIQWGDEVMFGQRGDNAKPQFLCTTCINDDEVYSICQFMI